MLVKSGVRCQGVDQAGHLFLHGRELSKYADMGKLYEIQTSMSCKVKVLLEHSQTYPFTYLLWLLFYTSTSALSLRQRSRGRDG